MISVWLTLVWHQLYLFLIPVLYLNPCFPSTSFPTALDLFSSLYFSSLYFLSKIYILYYHNILCLLCLVRLSQRINSFLPQKNVTQITKSTPKIQARSSTTVGCQKALKKILTPVKYQSQVDGKNERILANLTKIMCSYVGFMDPIYSMIQVTSPIMTRTLNTSYILLVEIYICNNCCYFQS